MNLNRIVACVIGCALLLVALSACGARSGAIATYSPTPEDDALLDEVTRAAFLYFTQEAHPATGLVPDKTSLPGVCSVAAQGFGFAVLPVGVERGWIARDAAEEQALRGLRTLRDTSAKRHGMFAHFLDMETGELSRDGYETGASTIDSALMIAGALVAGEYFGGEVKEIANQLYAEMDWASYQNPLFGNQVHMLWEPRTAGDFDGPGRLTPPRWDWYTDEALLISLLGIAAPNPEHRLGREAMYNWNRPTGSYGDGEPFVYSYPGTLFTYTFAQLYFDLRRVGPDAKGVDWFENTRRAAIANRDWCRDNAKKFTTYGRDRWGITACSGPAYTYVVPGHQPRGADGDSPAGGTLATYGAPMVMPWLPRDAVAAVRHMRDLVIDGTPVWKDPGAGGYGLADAFNIDQKWVSGEHFGIANGPMVLGIENARTGLIWDLFHQNEHITAGLSRAGFGEYQHVAPPFVP